MFLKRKSFIVEHVVEGERLFDHLLLFAQPHQELPARSARTDDERRSHQFRRVRQRGIQFLSGSTEIKLTFFFL